MDFPFSAIKANELSIGIDPNTSVLKSIANYSAPPVRTGNI